MLPTHLGPALQVFLIQATSAALRGFPRPLGREVQHLTLQMEELRPGKTKLKGFRTLILSLSAKEIKQIRPN